MPFGELNKILVTSLLDSLQSIFLSRRSPDKRVWSLESFAKFTSKSFFLALSNPSSIESSLPHRKIWKLAVLPRVKAFSWTAALGRINTMDMLQRRRPFMPLSSHWCALCHMDGESVHHIFLHCSFTHKVWIHFISRIGVYWVMPKKLQLMFSSWKSFGASLRSTKFGDYLLHAILWGIWRERNNRIFLGKDRNCEEVIEAIIRELGSWLKASLEFEDILLADFLRDWLTTISCLSSQP